MKTEIVSIKNGSLYSKENGEFTLPNLHEHWYNKILSEKSSKDITKEPLYSYINLCSDLMDDWGFVDTSYVNDLVPSMSKNISAADGYWWIGFPNSNSRNEDGEEWNYFSILLCDASSGIGWGSLDDEIVFETIEDVLGFIKSNNKIRK